MKTPTVYSHCEGTEPGHVLGTGNGEQWSETRPGSIVSYYAGPVDCTCPNPVLVQCE